MRVRDRALRANIHEASRLADFAGGGGFSLLPAPDDCWCDNAESFLQTEVLGFCGCFCPDANLRYVLGGLAKIEVFDWSIRDTPEGAFFCYWANEAGLAEHGSSIPGWLTPFGKGVLAMLREWDRTPLSESPDDPR